MFYQKTTLPNGLQVLSEQIPGVRSISLGIWFRVGSRDELPTQQGLSHFMEHMMFKGTPTRSALDISMAFDEMGAELNAFTSKECTCYYVRALDEYLEISVEILADMLQNSEFASEAIETEREVVIEEIARYEDEPSDHVGDIFTKALFPTHQLGRPIIGTRDIVATFGHNDCAQYLKQHYHAGNMVISAAGNVKHEQLLDLAERFFGSLPCGTTNDRGEVHEGPRKFLAFETKDTEQAHLLYGMPGITLNSDDRFASSLMDTALGGPMSSRLFQEVREKRGLAYAVFTATQAFMNAAQFYIYAGTRPGNLAEVISILKSEIALLLDKGLTQEELDRVKEYTVGHMVLSEESTRSHMYRLGIKAVQGLEILSLDEGIQRYRAVTLDDVQRIARQVLTADPTIAVISPLKESELQAILA
ncbi:MAG: insulinase family protein [Coriobacteriales bacterium]|jgi:predicted Zn-dependent peptidase|nr:insulinase family protein [Coriobacteriales bacterium]